MIRYFLRTLRALVISTLGIGGGVALFAMIVFIIGHNGPEAFQHALKSGMMVGLVYATFLLAVLLPLDLFSRTFLSKGVYKDVWELEQVREIQIHGTAKEVLAISRRAILKIGNIKSVSDDSEHLLTRALTGSSLRSPGEEIEVEINPLAENVWSAKCMSKPRSRACLFDYGKNFENVQTWVAEITDDAGQIMLQTDRPK